MPFVLHFRNGLIYQEKVVKTESSATKSDESSASVFDFDCGSKAVESHIVDTGPDGYIYVMKNGTIFANPKVTKSTPRFHHSSFFAGKHVESSGMLIIEKGVLKSLLPHSGHYRPKQEFHLLAMLIILKKNGVDLSSVSLDIQRVMKIVRAVGAGKY